MRLRFVSKSGFSGCIDGTDTAPRGFGYGRWLDFQHSGSPRMNQPNFYEMIGFQTGNSEPVPGAPDAPDLDRAAFFIDFDGTIVEIADRPDKVVVPEDSGRLLRALHERTDGATAVVSGRKMDDLKKFLPDFPGIMIGSHGAERWEEGKLWRHPASESGELACIRRMVDTWAESHPGVLVEEKPCAVVLHFRQAPEVMAEADRFMQSLVQEQRGFMLHHAKMALEIQPSDVSKRDSIGRLMDRWSRRQPIAFGDDATDEGMFDAVNRRGGLTIKVGPRDTCASFRLNGPEDVRSTLQSWLDSEPTEAG